MKFFIALLILALNFAAVTAAPCAVNCLQTCTSSLDEALAKCRSGYRGRSCRRRANEKADECRDICSAMTIPVSSTEESATTTSAIEATTSADEPTPTPLTCFQICDAVYQQYSQICASQENPESCYSDRQAYQDICQRDCTALSPPETTAVEEPSSTTPAETTTTVSSTESLVESTTTDPVSETTVAETTPAETTSIAATETSESSASPSATPPLPLEVCFAQCDSNYAASSIICEARASEEQPACFAERDLYQTICRSNCQNLFPETTSSTSETVSATETSSEETTTAEPTSTAESSSSAEATATVTETSSSLSEATQGPCEQSCLDSFTQSFSSCGDDACTDAARTFLFACLEPCNGKTLQACSPCVTVTNTFLSGSFSVLPVSTITVTA